MKLNILPIVIALAGLTFFFSFADCKGNNSVDAPQITQANGSSTDCKSESGSASEHMSSLLQTASKENAVSETSPETGIQSSAGKPVTETTPIAVASAPIAVPAATPEEAKKLNAEAIKAAIAEKEKTEPFYSLYQNGKLETVCFQGTIRATSTIPDSEKNDYDNCLYALFVEIDSLLSDVSPDMEIACEAIINAPIMKDKMIIQQNKFLPGDKILCTCAEYDTMSQGIQEIQLSDDIQSYEHQQYYPIEIRKISAFQKGGNKDFARREIAILPIQTLPKDEKAAALRKERIQSEIARIEEEIKKRGGSFEKWKEDYKPIAEKYKKLRAEGYKGWINDSYFAAVGGETSYKTKEYIDGLLPYKKYLEENNIDLIVVRIPRKNEFARCVLASEDFQENPIWVEHYYECLKNDIELVDPMPAMWEHRFDYPLFYFFNDPSELHPFEGQAFISAMVLSDVLKRYSFSVSEQQFELEDCTYENSRANNHWPEGNAKYNPEEDITFKRVTLDKQSIGGLSVNTGSPFVFLSNSYFAYPKRNQGASVPAYTAFYTHHIPDWFYQDGIGNPMLRNLIADHQALSKRKAVIMVGHPGYWDGSFPPFPKYILDDAKSISQEHVLNFLSSDIKILDDGSFLFTKENDGATQFTQNTDKEQANKSFRIELSVPGKKEKKRLHAADQFRNEFIYYDDRN